MPPGKLEAMINQLKERLAKEEATLKERAGHIVSSSPTGPIGIGLVREIVAVLEAQAQEIESLKERIEEVAKQPARAG